jgi:hypothetical protein
LNNKGNENNKLKKLINNNKIFHSSSKKYNINKEMNALTILRTKEDRKETNDAPIPKNKRRKKKKKKKSNEKEKEKIFTYPKRPKHISSDRTTVIYRKPRIARYSCHRYAAFDPLSPPLLQRFSHPLRRRVLIKGSPQWDSVVAYPKFATLKRTKRITSEK